MRRGGLSKSLYRGGLNARGRGRGGAGRVNTFRMLWQPKLPKKRSTPNGEQDSSFTAKTVPEPMNNGAETCPTTVSDVHPISTTSRPRRDPRGERPATSPRQHSPPLAFSDGLDVLQGVHDEFLNCLVRFGHMAPEAAEARLQAGYRDAVAQWAAAGAIPAGKSTDIWRAWFDHAFGTMHVTTGSRKHSERSDLRAGNLGAAARAAGL